MSRKWLGAGTHPALEELMTPGISRAWNTALLQFGGVFAASFT